MIRKKKNLQKELFGIFSSKVQNIIRFSINSMIRIRFSGSRELIWNGFSGAQYWTADFSDVVQCVEGSRTPDVTLVC